MMTYEVLCDALLGCAWGRCVLLRFTLCMGVLCAALCDAAQSVGALCCSQAPLRLLPEKVLVLRRSLMRAGQLDRALD